MPTPSAIMDMSASLLNDTAQTQYTDEAQLPYLNMALDELQEFFEQNNVPKTNETSDTLEVAEGVDTIGLATIPPLPTGLIEIQQLWESPSGQESWTPMTKREFIPHYLQNGQEINQFLIWAYIDDEIKLIAANQDNDIKIDYIKSIFNTPIVIADVGVDITIKNVKSFLGFRTAGLCAQFIMEDPERAGSLNGFASVALDRTLGISTKGRQSIVNRRRPFRAAYKARTVY